MPGLLWLFCVARLCRRRPDAFHGDARFAGTADLRRAGLLRRVPDEGLLIGRHRGRYLWLNGAQHALMIAPTRSGKSTSVAIPVLLSYEASAVVLDVKGELHALTSGYRQQLGQQIVVWSPYEEDSGHRFNPFSALLHLDARLRLAELQTLAAIVYSTAPGADPFWSNQARTAFVAFASYLFEQWDQHRAGNRSLDPNTSPLFPSMQRVYVLSAGGGQSLASHLERLQADSFVSEATRAALSSLAGMAEQTLSSVIASMQAPLQQFLSPVLAAATNASDFDVHDLRRKRMTVYVVIPPKKLDEAGMLLNLFFSTVIGGNLHGDARSDASITHQVLMLMDEFTAMGRLDVWARRISVSASYGVRDLTIVQSRAQLRGVYGAEDAQNFITNHAASLVFTPREQEDAQEYSQALGDRTVRRKQRSSSHGQGGRSRSTSEQDERRPLMLPQEIKELPRDEQLIFLEGCRPIRCRKNWYFKDRMLKKRLLPAVPKLRRAVAEEVSAPVQAVPSQAAPMPPASAAHASTAEERMSGADTATAETLQNTQKEPEEMKLRHAMFGLAMAGGIASGCTRGEPGEIDSYKAKGAYIRSLPEEPKSYPRNPNPKHAYELTVTLANAPGPMVMLGGLVQYNARDCAYVTNRWAGSSASPVTLEDIVFTQMDAVTWRAVFHADAMLDEDYDGPDGPMAPCHWTAMAVRASFSASAAHDEMVYTPSMGIWDEATRERSETIWFSRYRYPRDSSGHRIAFEVIDPSRLPKSDVFSFTLSIKRREP